MNRRRGSEFVRWWELPSQPRTLLCNQGTQTPIPGSPQFHDPLSGTESLNHLDPIGFDPVNKVRGPAVSKAEPKQAAIVTRTGSKDDEIFILADQNPVFGESFFPDDPVIGPRLPPLKHMDGVSTAIPQPDREMHWQLVVDEKLHAALTVGAVMTG